MNAYRKSTGTAQASNSGVDATVIAAPGAGRVTRVLSATIQVIVSASGGAGTVSLEDGVGGTQFFRVNADSPGTHAIQFADPGYPLTANTLLNITVEGAATTQATARCTAIANNLGA